MIFTTLKKLEENNACRDRYNFLVAALGEDYGAETPIPVSQILKTNGLNDAIWALRAADGGKEIAVKFAIACAERVLPIFEERFPDDDRPRKAIQTAKKGTARAADAADAATAAAQDASDAVAALSATVAKLVASLKAQITSLTNLVIKIQKKVKA